MKTRRMLLMGQLIRENSRNFARAAISTVFTVSIALLTPLLFAAVVDSVIGTDPLRAPAPFVEAFLAIGGREYLTKNLWIVSLVLIGLSLVRSVFMYIRGRSTAQAAEKAALTLRTRLYQHLQHLSYRYHVKAETGDLIQRCTSDVETARRFLAVQFVEIINILLTVGIAMVILFSRNVPLTFISTAVMIPLFLFAYFFFRQVLHHFSLSDIAEGKMSATLQENLTGVRVVRAFGRQRYEMEKFEEKSRDFQRKTDKLLWFLAVYWSGSDLLILVQMCVSLLVGIVYATNGTITLGTLIVYNSYIGMILWPVRNLGRILSDAGKALVSLERIDDVLRQPAEKDAPGSIAPDLTGDIVFENVSFAYEEKKQVLSNLSFTIRGGETVAILGATGAGKSTLVHLLQRLYEPTSGRITIGGHPLELIEKKHLRKHVGLVLQEPFLYSKTIRQNVGIAKRNPTEAEVKEVAGVAQADSFIRESEQGYETLVGERGVTLSGGQKQRIAIARTLLKPNHILIFDDSLSAVDTQTDAAIRKALAQKRTGVTTLMISHRLITLSEADRILVLEGGRIVDQGTHRELIARPGLYRRIHQIQNALEEELEDEEMQEGR